MYHVVASCRAATFCFLLLILLVTSAENTHSILSRVPLDLQVGLVEEGRGRLENRMELRQ